MSRILITGSSRGIGRETALLLARAGHSVIATMRNPAASPELARISAAEHLPIQIETLDVTSEASVRACFERVQSSGPLDVLVNNAGIERMGSVEETPLEDFVSCMETNYFGALRCIKAVLAAMRERGRGTIVNVSSVAGKICPAPMTPYAASKFALEAASEGLAQEVRAFGVRLAIIVPGIIDTRMAREVEALQRSAFYPQAKRIAAMFAAFLARGAASPDSVAARIREVIESEDWELRYTASPDAGPFLGWRASMSDEQWTAWGALNDEDWTSIVKRDLGLDVNL